MMSNLQNKFYQLRELVENKQARCVLDALLPALEKTERYNVKAVVSIRYMDVDIINMADHPDGWSTLEFYTVDGESLAPDQFYEEQGEAEELVSEAEDLVREGEDEQDEAEDALNDARAELAAAEEQLGEAEECLKEAPEDSVLREDVDFACDKVKAATNAHQEAKESYASATEATRLAEESLEAKQKVVEGFTDAEKDGPERDELMFNYVRQYNGSSPDEECARAAGLGIVTFDEGPKEGDSYLHLKGCGMDLSPLFMQYEANKYGGIQPEYVAKINSYAIDVMPDWKYFCSRVGITEAITASDAVKASHVRDLTEVEDPVAALAGLLTFAKEN